MLLKVVVPSGDPLLVSASVTLPFAFAVNVYCGNWPVNTAVSLPSPPLRMLAP